MLKKMTLSINPLYRCNFRCSFCYLTKEQLDSTQLLNLNTLELRLKEVTKHTSISHIDLYGGEIALLPEEYLKEMLSLINSFYTGKINLVTNLSSIPHFFLVDQIQLSVSWDYRLRQDYQQVLNNIISLPKNVHILMLASPKMLEWEDREIREVIQLYNSIGNIASVEIKPYSSNQANQLTTSYKQYEEFIQKWLQERDTFQFQFVNEKNIQDSLNGVKSSWSDDHLYITPTGNFAVLDFDKNQHEYFVEVSSFQKYQKWCAGEKDKIAGNPYCSKCSYLGNCLSEHLKGPLTLNGSCDGFRGLLDWYQSQKLIPSPKTTMETRWQL